MNNELLAQRLQNLRKAHGYSQEQLADLVGVSRQAVSKWESGASLPDIDNLVRLSELYAESLDSIVKGSSQEGKQENAQQPTITDAQLQSALSGVLRRGLINLWHYEYKSKRSCFGLPLVHVNLGRQNGRLAVARGVFAVGTVSVGLVSIGVFSLGLLSIGTLALGLLTLACVGAGLAAAGVTVGGIFSFGVVALGYVSVGVTAIGVYSAGVAAAASSAAVGVAAGAPVAIGKEGVDGLHTMLATASTTAEQARQFLLLHTPQTPSWIINLLAYFATIL